MTWTYEEYQRGDLDNKTLQLHDKVVFFLPKNKFTLNNDLELTYIVYSTCLLSENGRKITIPIQFRVTSGIFNYLNFSSTNRENFCSKAYGYKSDLSYWPVCIFNDFPALTRLVKALYDELSKIYAKNQQKLNVDKLSKQAYDKSEDIFSQKLELVNNVNNNFNNGKTIKVAAVTPKIIRGEEKRGCSISGKTSRSDITSGSLSYSEIIA